MKTDPILITGVGKRVGLSLSEYFVSQGIPVIGTYRSERSSLRHLRNIGVELYQSDFDKTDDVQNLIKEIQARHRALRAIIHNASDWMPETSEVSPSDTMNRMMRVHVSAPYEINLALTPLLEACEGDCSDIIHIGDYTSGQGSEKHIAYAASKAAQDNLTLSFAKKLGPKVKVNSIAPALILFNEHDDETYREKTLKKSLMQREGGLQEMQQAVSYLMTSSYITGRVLPLDGGRHLL